MYILVYLYRFIYIYIYICSYIHVYNYVYIYMYIGTYIYSYLYINAPTLGAVGVESNFCVFWTLYLLKQGFVCLTKPG